MTPEEARAILDSFETNTDAEWLALARGDESAKVENPLSIEDYRALATPAEVDYYLRATLPPALASNPVAREMAAFMVGMIASCRDKGTPFGWAWASMRLSLPIDGTSAANADFAEAWGDVRFALEAIYHRTWEA